jgi:rhodanese-related sulfurtransferase
MAKTIDRREVRALADQGATLVEVLSPHAYEKMHISGAINIPLARLAEEAPGTLDPERPIIAYCYDFQ